MLILLFKGVRNSESLGKENLKKDKFGTVNSQENFNFILEIFELSIEEERFRKHKRKHL